MAAVRKDQVAPRREVKQFNFVQVRISGKGKYDPKNKSYVDFNQVVAGTDKTRNWIETPGPMTTKGSIVTSLPNVVSAAR